MLRQDNDPGGARSSFTAALRASRRNGDRSGIAYRRDSLGQVRAHLGRERHERAHAAGTMLSFGQALDLVAAKTVPG